MGGFSELWTGLLEGLGQLLSFLYDLVPSFGLAIILLTIAVRMLMLPLTVKQTRSMQAIQKLQPEVKKIQAKHKGDRQKTNEEVMKLYQEAGANPLGGCWPMLLQMPVFIALYRLFVDCGKFVTKAGKRICAPGFIGVKYLPAGSALRAAMIGGQAGFLGMDLGLTPTQVYRADGIIPAVPYGIMILLMAATQWFSAKQMSSRQGADAQPAQAQMMMRIMPVFLAFISLNFPVALTIYWVAGNLWTIGQQYVMLRLAEGEGLPLLSRFGSAARGSDPEPSTDGKAKATDPDGQNGKVAPKHKGSGARRRRKR